MTVLYEDVHPVLPSMGFEDYYRSVKQADVQFVLTRRPIEPWSLQSLETPSVAVQFGSDGGASIASGNVAPSSFVFIGRHYPSDSEILFNGERLLPNEFIALPPRCRFVFTASGPRTWFSIAMQCAGSGWHDRVLRSLEQGQPSIVPIGPGAHRSLIPTVETFLKVTAAGGEPAHLQHVSSALLECVHGILAEDGRYARSVRNLKSLDVVSRALDALRSDSEKLYVEDLAAAGRVHPRTLLRAFHQIFRMGPVGYLRYRQLSQLRLRLCDPHGMRTVTEIMQSVGASDMGRLSGAYRKLFDETPSETLRVRKAKLSLTG